MYDKVTTDIAPSLDGGKEWHPMSYSHRTKMVYVPVYDFAMDLQAKKMEWKRGEWYLGAKVINFNAGAGHIKAFDAATGKLVWDKSQSYPATSGILTTGGGLVFYGDPEGYFSALDDETGEQLWTFQVGLRRSRQPDHLYRATASSTSRSCTVRAAAVSGRCTTPTS